MKEFSNFLRFGKFLEKCCNIATLALGGSRISVFLLTCLNKYIEQLRVNLQD